MTCLWYPQGATARAKGNETASSTRSGSWKSKLGIYTNDKVSYYVIAGSLKETLRGLHILKNVSLILSFAICVTNLFLPY